MNGSVFFVTYSSIKKRRLMKKLFLSVLREVAYEINSSKINFSLIES